MCAWSRRARRRNAARTTASIASPRSSPCLYSMMRMVRIDFSLLLFFFLLPKFSLCFVWMSSSFNSYCLLMVRQDETACRRLFGWMCYRCVGYQDDLPRANGEILSKYASLTDSVPPLPFLISVSLIRFNFLIVRSDACEWYLFCLGHLWRFLVRFLVQFDNSLFRLERVRSSSFYHRGLSDFFLRPIGLKFVAHS